MRRDAPDDVGYPAHSAPGCGALGELEAKLVDCRACPRLVAWREQVAAVKRSSFRDWEYWARPVPGFGPADAPLALIGLAPAAHGGNRTGRIFTGDPSGEVLYAALYEVGLASQPTATHRDDGLALYGVRITVPVHCAPPDNRPSVGERDTCRPWLARELELLRPGLRVVVALGGFAWQALLPVLADAGWSLPRPRPKFGHGAQVLLTDARSGRDLHLLGCYHPSQRNVSTHTLTTTMLHTVLRHAAQLAGVTGPGPRRTP
ncbi:uracil-DNA glycosylase [Amycolatopsis cynarae]|uniref:Type-5 uracil-DNA glycosylase n=1 Tax=Amycolatopsis cynarae TaxID=2995223 RepID=A0ABY7B6Z7_9PSEU|nr:uracil-DNA glycosylase [Amycolatopsis sp. HUAS 11-8]WAL68095.1 uracil-DNA glycosylase [Amycolatopsis sp. HUAS 11-8]